MSKRRIVWIAVAVVVTVLAGVSIWAFVIREREGANDFVPADLRPETASTYENWLAHSQDEYDRGVYHLTAWHITRQDGKLVRLHVASFDAWYRILEQNGNKVVRLPENFMKNIPVEGEVR